MQRPNPKMSKIEHRIYDEIVQLRHSEIFYPTSDQKQPQWFLANRNWYNSVLTEQEQHT